IDDLADLPPVLLTPLDALEFHADELSAFDHEPLGRVVFDDLDPFLFRVLELPRRRLEVRPRSARDDSRVGASESARCAAAVHRGIADADDQHSRPDALYVA